MYECGTCGRMYEQRGSFKRHLLSHTVGVYSCPKCTKLFASKAFLRNHIRAKHQHVEKPIFLCHKCGNAYNNKKHLVRHSETHSDKVYVCHKCDKLFTTKRNFS